MAEPTGCILWNQPEVVAAGVLADHFVLIKELQKESHFWRYVLECRECGHLYFYEIFEEIDWRDGNDPQFCTWIPVRTDREIATLQATRPMELREFRPCLVKDWPRDAARPRLRWLTKR